jgi:hypothetical protein
VTSLIALGHEIAEPLAHDLAAASGFLKPWTLCRHFTALGRGSARESDLLIMRLYQPENPGITACLFGSLAPPGRRPFALITPSSLRSLPARPPNFRNFARPGSRPTH